MSSQIASLNNQPSGKGLIAALATVILWASAFPTIRIGLADFDPVPLASLRFAIASVPMLIWFAIRRPALPRLRHLALFALCGAIGIALYNVGLNTGQRTVSAGAASFIVNTVPVITAVLAVLFLGERFGARAWIGTLLSFGGVGLIALGQPGGLTFGAGATLVLAAAACQGAFFILQRSLVPLYGAPLCATLAIVTGAIFLSPWLGKAVVQAGDASPSGIAAVVYLGLIPGGLGFVTWAVAQGAFGASRAANFLYLVPPVAVLMAIALNGDLPGWLTLVGGSVAITGVVIVNTQRKASSTQRTAVTGSTSKLDLPVARRGASR